MASQFSVSAYDRRAAKRRFIRRANHIVGEWAGPFALAAFIILVMVVASQT